MDEFDRIREVGVGQPEESDAAYEAARVALLERIEASQGASPAARFRRPRYRRILGLSGAVVTAAVVLFAIFSSGETPTAAPGLARAAELEFLAEITPKLLIQGPQWNIAGIEAESAAHGRTVFYSEFRPETPVQWDPRRFAELRWRPLAEQEQIAKVKAQGWAHLETQRVDVIDIVELEETGQWSHPPQRIAEIFAPTNDPDRVQPMVALWEQEGRAFELCAFDRLAHFKETSERVGKVDTGEFINDSRPGLAIEPIEETITLPNGRNKTIKGAVVGAPPSHEPDTPSQEGFLFRKVFLNDGKGEAPIMRQANGRTWMIVRRYAGISEHWLSSELPPK